MYFILLFLLIHKRKRPALATPASIYVLHKMHEGIFMPQMRVIVNHHAKVRGLVHEPRTPGMVVEAIIFAPTRDQMTRRILAVNAPARAVNFLPFSRLVVGLSPGTFRIHANLIVHLGVDLA